MISDTYDVAIVGGGISGLFVASQICRQHVDARIVVLERGHDYSIRQRERDSDPNVYVSGIGGAGTLGGGKLCDIPASGDIWKKTVVSLPSLDTFISELPLPAAVRLRLNAQRRNSYFKLKNRPLLLQKSYQSIPLSMKQMQTFVENLVSEAVLLGVEIYSTTKVAGIEQCGTGFRLQVAEAHGDYVYAKYVVVASGRSSAGEIPYLLSNVPIQIREQTADLGVRVRFPRGKRHQFSVVGEDVKIKSHIGGCGVRTFCTCTGGESAIVAIGDRRYVDGHFGLNVTPFVNVGIMSRDGKIEGYHSALDYCGLVPDNEIKSFSVKDFARYARYLKCSRSGSRYSRILDSIVVFTEALRSVGIFDGALCDYEVLFPSVDRYWPLVETDDCFETACSNLYVIGDAAGVSRGYLQSLWSAWCAGMRIVRRIREARGCFSDHVMRLADELQCTCQSIS